MASSAADGARPLSGSQVAPAAIEDLLRREGLKPVWWTNAPGDRYETHDHAYDKVLFCVRGSITFTLHPQRSA